MQLMTSEMLVTAEISATDPRVIVLVTRVAEVRVPLKHGHVFAAEAETIKALKAMVDECLTLDAMAQNKDAENAVYYSPTAGAVFADNIVEPCLLCSDGGVAFCPRACGC